MDLHYNSMTSIVPLITLRNLTNVNVSHNLLWNGEEAQIFANFANIKEI